MCDLNLDGESCINVHVRPVKYGGDCLIGKDLMEKYYINVHVRPVGLGGKVSLGEDDLTKSRDNREETWWSSDGDLMEFWWRPDGVLMETWWSSDGDLMEFWWRPDGVLMEPYNAIPTDLEMTTFTKDPLRTEYWTRGENIDNECPDAKD